jgi:hypothetical protein
MSMSRSNIHSVNAVVALLVALAVPCSAALAQPSRPNDNAVLLEIRPRAGDTISLRMQQDAEFVGTTRVGGRDSTMRMTTSMDIRARAVIESSTVKSATVLTITDSVTVTSSRSSMADALEQGRRGIVGKRVLMRVLPDGSSEILSNPAELSAELRTLVSQMPPTLPNAPVQVGASWTRSVPVPMVASGASEMGALRTTFRFDSLSRNRDLAYISLDGELVHDAAQESALTGREPPMSGVLRGSMVVDLRRGWMVDSRATITLRSVMVPTGGNVAEPVQVTLRITQRMHAMDKP